MEILRIIFSTPFRPHIGDPTLLGWLTVLAYLIAAALSLACVWQAERIFGQNHLWQHRLIWGGLAAGLLFLGVNKQLDIQSWFTAVAKAIAYEQGWYDMGQRAQVLFIAGMGIVSLGVLVVSAWFLRHVWRQYWLLGLGVLFLARFVIVRAASFYGVSLPELSRYTGGFRINWLLEIIAASVMALAAALNLRRARRLS
jgi:hypothetical protein